MSRRRLALATLPVLSTLLIAACGSGGDSASSSGSGSASGSGSGSGSASGSVASAEVDGTKLVVYSGRQEALVGELFEQFEKATGIEVSVRYGDSAELAAQLLEEGDRTDADLFFSQDAGALGALDDEGRLTDLPAATLAKVQPHYRSADGRWVGVSGRARVVVYNPEELPEADVPDSVFDLTDDKWKGKVGFAPTNASFQAFVTGMRVISGEDKTKSWLEGFADNDPKEYPNNVAVLEAVDKGEIPLGLINHYYWYERVDELGADAVTAELKYLGNGDPGALVNVAGVGLLKESDRADAAQSLVDYLLGAEAQRFFAEETKEYPLAAGVPAAAGLPPLSSLKGPEIDLSELDSLAETLAMLEDAGLT